MSHFQYRNMAVRHRILNLARTMDLTLLTNPFNEAIPELRSARVMTSPALRGVRMPHVVSVLWAASWVLTRVRRGEFDVVYTFHDQTAVVGCVAKKLGRAHRWIWDVLDDPALELHTVEAQRDRGPTMRHHLSLSLQRLAVSRKQACGPLADGVIVTAVRPVDPLARILSSCYGVSAERLLCVPNGVDLTLTRPSEASARFPGFSVFYVGTVSPERGLDVLLPAMRRVRKEVPDARLVLAGPQTQADGAWMESTLDGLGLGEVVRYLGPLPSEEVWNLMERSAVCVYPFHRDELSYVFPVKVYEYLAMGRPVVASRLHGVAEIVANGDNGLLVEPGDERALADALIAIARDSELRARLEANARRSVERFDWSMINATVNEWMASIV